MLDTVEKQSNRRAFLMMFMASAFLAWQVPAMDFFERFAQGTPRTVDIVGLLGGLAWLVALVILFAKGGRKRGTAAERAALEDELVKANRMAAFRVGYFSMLVVAALMLALSLFTETTPNDVAQIILAIGVVAPMYTFAWLERRNG